MENEDTRRLKIEIPSCTLSKAAPDPTWTNTALAGGWTTNDPALGLLAHWTGTIDISGYVREMKTFYPAGGMIQSASFPNTEIGGEGSILYTIVSSIPLDPLAVSINILGGSGEGFLSVVGSPGNQNWETVIFAETETSVVNANITPNVFGIQQPLINRQSGSLSPTATDTLYVMRMLIPLGINQTSISVPASRVIIPGVFANEPDVEYMMRLKRSTELSQQV